MSKARRVLVFPEYSPAELLADRLVHAAGVPAGLVAGAVLLARGIAHGGPTLVATIAIYVGGLVGMLGASAAYQLSPPGLRKEILRRLDRAMIFIMIAGTYTPLAANVLYGRGGLWLCALQWGLAAAGIFVTLRYPRRFENALLALYLGMGWLVLVLVHDCFARLSAPALALIFIGGAAYTLGAVIQALERPKFHNPLWHGLILVAAACHYAAISLQLTGGV
jgi:hemolysin III